MVKEAPEKVLVLLGFLVYIALLFGGPANDGMECPMSYDQTWAKLSTLKTWLKRRIQYGAYQTRLPGHLGKPRVFEAYLPYLIQAAVQGDFVPLGLGTNTPIEKMSGC